MLQNLTRPRFAGLVFPPLLCPVVLCESEQENSGPEHQGRGTELALILSLLHPPVGSLPSGS